jgi:hypothetical protein
MAKNQTYAVRGTVMINGASKKFSVTVKENVAKGLESKDSRVKDQAFAALASKVRESINKKCSQNGNNSGGDAQLKPRDFNIKEVRYV